MRRLRGEERAHPVPRRRRHAEALDGHVEIEIFQPGAVLHGVNHPHACFDPKRAQILDIRRVVRLYRRLVDQKFDLEQFAVRQQPLAFLAGKTRLLEQLRGLAQQRPVLPRSVRHRRHERHAEHLVRHLAPKRLEQFELFRRRWPAHHHVGILERRMGARVGAIHDGLVGPFEIERLDQRFTDARILEFLAAGIDEPALRARRRFIGQYLALDAAILDGRKIIARRPHPGGEFLAVEIVLSGKSLERDVAVAVELVAHRVEIIAAAVDRQIGGPPILDALEFDVAIDLELPDLVGPGAKRDIERRFIERPRRVIGFREDRQAGDIERHVARALLGEGDDQRRVVGRFRLHHVAHLRHDQGMALGLQRGQREGGIMRGQFRAVVKPRLRPQREAIGQLVG